MTKEKLKANLNVKVTETEDDVHTQITGLVGSSLDKWDRADIVCRVINSLGITVTDVIIWYLHDGPKEADA